MGNFWKISEKYLGNKREKPGTGHCNFPLFLLLLLLDNQQDPPGV